MVPSAVKYLYISRSPKIKHDGIIVLRFFKKKPEYISERILNLFSSNLSKKFAGSLVIISENYLEINR